MLYMLAYHSDNAYEPWKKSTIVVLTSFVFFIFFFIMYEKGYQNGQYDASRGIQKGSPAKSYWQGKQVITIPDSLVYRPETKPWN